MSGWRSRVSGGAVEWALAVLLAAGVGVGIGWAATGIAACWGRL